MRQIVFDLETTGFKFAEGHRIVEIGAIEMVRGAITRNNFHVYVNPEREMPQDAFRVHGISGKFLRDKPVFADPQVAQAFVDFIDDAELIAHNGLNFDLPFLNAELVAAGLPVLKNKLLDTLLMARKKFPGAPANLDALCSRFEISTSERERDGHGALLDSRLLAEVYIQLTGGRQAGLNFRDDGGPGTNQGADCTPAKQRPVPLASLVTAEEEAAHKEFVSGLGDAPLWAKYAGSPS
ncbi:MAG: DNA polymerase III subunit epsilon [Pseudomonadota bacterium]